MSAYNDAGASVEHPARECRCCRMPVPFGKLACAEHWRMLPQPLQLAIISTYSRHAMRDYVANVKQADKIWQAAGLWKQGVPS